MKLNNKIEIPQLGLGTFLVEQSVAEELVYQSITMGYRLIDTADVYVNEQEIGKGIERAINDNIVKREDLFISSKLNAKIIDKSQVEIEVNKSLRKLNVDYLDCYLIHWIPRSFNTLMEIWGEFEKLYQKGLVKSIGVCNITLYYLDKLLKECNIKPQIVQVEYHPFLQQETLLEYCEKQEIQVMGYGQFAKSLVFENDTLKEIANKYNTEISNVVIKWCLSNDVVIIPKSSNVERLRSNYNSSKLNLDKNDLNIIDGLNDGLRVYRDPENNPFTIRTGGNKR